MLPIYRILHVLIALVISLTLLSAARADEERLSQNPPLFDAKTATLSNGLQIAVLADTRADRVRQMLWYSVGSSDEPRGLSGIAHYLEHMMFKGTALAPGDSFSRLITLHGGRENAFTSKDVTTYHQTVPSHLLQDIMQVEADRMRNLVLSLDELESERSVVLEERALRVDNSPFSRMREIMAATLYVRDPYGTPIIGWEHEINAITAEDLQAFYEQHYRPRNALLVVVGNTTLEEVLEIAQATYGTIPDLPYERVEIGQDPVSNMARTVALSDPAVAQDAWFRMMKTGGSSDTPGEEIAAKSMLMDIMAGDNSSRLYQALVLDEVLATSVSGFYNSLQRRGGQISLYAAATEGTDLADIDAAVARVQQQVMTDGITQEELDRVRDGALNSLVYLRDDVDRAARAVGQALSIGLTVEELNQWPTDIQNVTVEDVNAAARKVFQSNDHVTGYLTQPTQLTTAAGEGS